MESRNPVSPTVVFPVILVVNLRIPIMTNIEEIGTSPMDKNLPTIPKSGSVVDKLMTTAISSVQNHNAAVAAAQNGTRKMKLTKSAKTRNAARLIIPQIPTSARDNLLSPGVLKVSSPYCKLLILVQISIPVLVLAAIASFLVDYQPRCCSVRVVASMPCSAVLS